MIFYSPKGKADSLRVLLECCGMTVPDKPTTVHLSVRNCRYRKLLLYIQLLNKKTGICRVCLFTFCFDLTTEVKYYWKCYKSSKFIALVAMSRITLM